MSKKPNERLLLTWNEKKHPEIVEFFNDIEPGLYSHSVREAIKFYVKHKNSSNLEDSKTSLLDQELNSNIKKDHQEDSNFMEFDPSDI